MSRQLDDSAVRIEPLGDEALIVELGRTIAPELNAAVCALAERIRRAALPGVVELVPAFASVGVHYRPEAVSTAPGQSPCDALSAAMRRLLDLPAAFAAEAPRTIEIPVRYGGEFGPDLEETAALCGVSAELLIALHQEPDALRVYMLGFAPGAPYIGLLDERLAVPRLKTPRTQVPAGSVAIANRQSVIYPTAAPGGWRLIGRTPSALFDLGQSDPCLLRPGDHVRFRAVDAAEFERLAAGAERTPSAASRR